MNLSRYLAPAVLAASLGVAAAAAPAPARAQSDDLVRVLVNVADVVLRGGQPYYRYGSYGHDDRLVVQRDRYGNPVYYRYIPRDVYDNRDGPPYGNAYGYYRNRGYPVTGAQRLRCDDRGRCVAVYYDPRHDRHERWDDHRGRRHGRHRHGHDDD